MTAAEVRRELRRLGIRPSKRHGQSFLVRDGLAGRIAGEAQGESVLEVGPGLGALTLHLAGSVERLCCVELFGELAGYLRGLPELSGVEVVTGDFLELDPAKLPGYPFDVLVGNLPYSISTPALLRLCQPDLRSVKKAVVMLQLEVARRVAARPGSGDYGRLTLALWPHFTARALLDAKPPDFYPQPAVRSRVLVLTRRDSPSVAPELLQPFSRLVRVGFASRRKTLLNNLSSIMERDGARSMLDQAGISHRARAEELSPELLLDLARRLPL